MAVKKETKETKKTKKKEKIKSTTKLVVMEKCKECVKTCKIQSLPHAVLIKCPDFKAKKKVN